jgi:hypothetical protein
MKGCNKKMNDKFWNLLSFYAFSTIIPSLAGFGAFFYNLTLGVGWVGSIILSLILCSIASIGISIMCLVYFGNIKRKDIK